MSLDIFDRVKVTKNAPVTFPGNWKDYSGADIHWTAEMPVPDTVTRGVTTPGYFQKKKRGDLLPHTDFSQFEVLEYSYTPVHWRVSRPGRPQDFWEVSGDQHIADLPFTLGHAADSSGGSAEVQRAAAAITGAGFDALTSLAELRQTTNMLNGVSKRVGKLLTHKGRVRTAKELYSAWLEGRYGWRILAMEIRDLNDAIQEFDARRTIWTERSGYSYTDTSFEQGSRPVFDAVGRHYYDIHVTTSHSIRGSVAAKVKPARFQTNPLLTGWELVPFSFVLDWAIQVGDAIQALELVNAADGTTASVGVYSLTNVEVTHTDSSGGWGSIDKLEKGSCNLKFASTTRTPTSIPIQPKLSPRRLRPDQALDLTALYKARAVLS